MSGEPRYGVDWKGYAAQINDKHLDGLKGPGLPLKRTGHLETPNAPNALVETDDMVIVR